MKKLCLTFISLVLMIALSSSAAYSSNSSKKKSAKKKRQVSSQTTAPTQQTQTAPAVQQVERNHGIPRAKLVDAYTYAKNLYAAKQFDKAKDIFKKLVIAATDPDISSNSLYLYSQCTFRTEDYTGCVKALTILAKRWPTSPLIRTGYVSRFCSFLINEVANLQTNWDYYRFEERIDEKGNPVWKESIPPGFKIKRINFKLGFGLYRVLNIIDPNSPQTALAKQKLFNMLNTPITMVWVDEKAPPDKWGHPEDFFSLFSTNEKKDFSKVICERMFFDWQTDKFYQFLDMYDDVRNLKPRFIARTKQLDEDISSAMSTPPSPPVPGAAATVSVSTQQDPTATLTLAKLFQIAGYNPYDDSYTNLIESSPSDLNL